MSDMTASEMTASEMLDALDATGHWWMIGKGMARPGEPLFGCVIQEARVGGKTLAREEGDDLASCVERAIASVAR